MKVRCNCSNQFDATSNNNLVETDRDNYYICCDSFCPKCGALVGTLEGTEGGWFHNSNLVFTPQRGVVMLEQKSICCGRVIPVGELKDGICGECYVPQYRMQFGREGMRYIPR